MMASLAGHHKIIQFKVRGSSPRSFRIINQLLGTLLGITKIFWSPNETCQLQKPEAFTVLMWKRINISRNFLELTCKLGQISHPISRKRYKRNMNE